MTADEASEVLSAAVGHHIEMPPGVTVSTSPEHCAACGAGDPLHGDDDRQLLEVAQLHPLAANETDGAADSFFCQTCFAGWIEPDEPEPIAWVRPYWRLEEGS